MRTSYDRLRSAQGLEELEATVLATIPHQSPINPDAPPPIEPGRAPPLLPRQQLQPNSSPSLQAGMLRDDSLLQPVSDRDLDQLTASEVLPGVNPSPSSSVQAPLGRSSAPPRDTRSSTAPQPYSNDSSAENRNGVYDKRSTRNDQYSNEESFSPIDRNAPPVRMVHQPNPYSDIPSLYDMYVQASPREKEHERFGLKIFQNNTLEPDAIPMDLPVGPDYVVGPGDGLAIDLWGGVSQRMFRIVDREGRIALPEAGPLLVSGRAMGDVQQTVQQLMRTQFRDVSVDVSLSRLRTVRVYVVGEVSEPGAYDISSLSTPLNALFAAGGVTPRGSLRSLQHFRGKQLIETVDAYDLLLHGVRSDMARIENGDTLMVPPVGPQVTIEGMVRRPAIYELRTENSLEDALELAGGILPLPLCSTSKYSASKPIRSAPCSRSTLLPVKTPPLRLSN